MATERIDIVVSERGSRVVRRNIEDIGTGARSAQGSVQLLGRALGAIGGALAVRSILNLANAFDELNNQLRVATGEMGNVTAEFDKLLEISNKAGVAIEGSVSLFQRLSIASGELGTTQEELFGFVELVSKGLAVQGGSANTSAGAMLQLSQALGSGIVRAEEFNSILEGAFPIALAAAQGLDAASGSVARLRTLILEGSVTSREFFDAILAGAESIEEPFAAIGPTLRRSTTTATNQLTKMVGQINTLTGITGALANGLDTVTESTGAMAGAFAAFGVVLTAIAFPLLVTTLGALAAAITGVLVAMAPVIGVAGLALFSTLAIKAEGDADKLGEAFDSLTNDISGFAESIVGLDDGEALVQQFAELEQTALDSSSSVDEVAASLKEMQNIRQQVEQAKFTTDLVGVIPGIDLEASKKDLKEVLEIMDRSILTIKERQKSLTQSLRIEDTSAFDALLDGLRQEEFLLSQSNDERKIQEGLIIAETALKKALTAEQAQLVEEQLRINQALEMAQAEATAALEAQQAVLDEIVGPATEYAETMEILNELLRQGTITTEQFEIAQRDLRIAFLETQTDFASGFERGFLKVQRDVTDFASLAEDSLTSAFKGAEDALVDFVRTGKLDFSSLADSILNDIIRMSIRAAIIAPLFGGFGFGFGGGGAQPGMGFADGGLVTGPGGPRSDSIPANLSNGEFVVNAAATKEFLPVLEAINTGASVPSASLARQGGGTMGGGTTVQIFDQRTSSDAEPVETQEKQDGSGGRIIAVTIRDTMKREIQSGGMDSAMRNRFGVTPPTTRRS